MGLIIEYLKKRGKKYYWVDWVFDIILALTFIYLSLQVRQWTLECRVPSLPFEVKCEGNVCWTEGGTLNQTIPINISNITGGVK